jgi:hypothetical protein
MRLLKDRFQKLGTPESGLARRLLQRKHSRPQLVTETGEQVDAVSVGKLLAELCAPAC